MKIAIAYIPVIHQGYLDFITKIKPDTLYILGEEFYQDFKPIEKDIRKLHPAVIREQLLVSNIGLTDTKVLTKDLLSFRTDPTTGEIVEESLRSLRLGRDVKQNKQLLNDKSPLQFILPDEDISHLFAEKYLANQKITYVDFFLRWDTQASLKQHDIKTKLTLNPQTFEETILGQAYTEAAKSADFWRQVGAMIVKDKKVLFHTYNSHKPTANSHYFNGDPRGNFHKGIHVELSTALHAEAGLIATAAKEGTSLQNCDLYVTTFPCPPCAKLLAYSGIKRLYFTEGYSMLDGVDILKDQGVEIIHIRL